MYEGDNLMAEVVNKMDELKKEFNKDLFYDNEALLKKASYDMGKEEGKIEIARNMIKDNAPLDLITKYTNLSINEIKSLIN